jgi:hypothetical protein
MPEQSKTDQRTQSQSRSKPQTADRPAGRPSQKREEAVSRPVVLDATTDKVGDAKAASIKAGTAVATKGRASESNLAIKWIDVWIGNSKPCRFDVTTAQGNTLEVIVEQLAYRKVYTGTTSVSTQPVPMAAPGTPLKVIARDTTTGEMLEQPGHWYSMGAGGFFARLWQTIKTLFWNPKNE